MKQEKTYRGTMKKHIVIAIGLLGFFASNSLLADKPANQATPAATKTQQAKPKQPLVKPKPIDMTKVHQATTAVTNGLLSAIHAVGIFGFGYFAYDYYKQYQKLKKDDETFGTLFGASFFGGLSFIALLESIYLAQAAREEWQNYKTPAPPAPVAATPAATL